MNENVPAGTQTLARGLQALKHVVASDDGITVHEVAHKLDVHRTIASRILQALDMFDLVDRGDDGRYRGSVGLLELTAHAYDALREISLPVMRTLADELGSTVSLIVAEDGQAVALAVVTASEARYRIIFAEGSSHPLDRAAAGRMLSAMAPPRSTDPDIVKQARSQGWIRTFGEVEPGAHGLAVPIETAHSQARACLNLITYRPEVADSALPAMQAAAAKISGLLDSTGVPAAQS